ncbi:hypothetical protein ABF86_11055 [Nitrosomonas sp. GH22]|nr:hypothetical protein [Nitrosomonas sp. GH22]
MPGSVRTFVSPTVTVTETDLAVAVLIASENIHFPDYSAIPALAQALPLRYFEPLGIPSLVARKEFNLSNRRGT